MAPPFIGTAAIRLGRGPGRGLQMALVPAPAAVRSTMRARQRCFCGVLRSAMIASRRRRSSAVMARETPVRIPLTRTRPEKRESSSGRFCSSQSTRRWLDPAASGAASPATKDLRQALPCRRGGVQPDANGNRQLAGGFHPRQCQLGDRRDCSAIESRPRRLWPDRTARQQIPRARPSLPPPLGVALQPAVVTG